MEALKPQTMTYIDLNSYYMSFISSYGISVIYFKLVQHHLPFSVLFFHQSKAISHPGIFLRQ